MKAACCTSPYLRTSEPQCLSASVPGPSTARPRSRASVVVPYSSSTPLTAAPRPKTTG
ncbi:hypothetical protein DL95DRAFT_385529 [Leptodontidium sp. 2 PMI_412]|nr:hypothetical protein DL95DRAFT_385529 [Leptodontidium sp. 2 PMI_412]